MQIIHHLGMLIFIKGNNYNAEKRVKKKAIVFCATGNMAFAIGSVMMDIIAKTSLKFDEFVIIHNGMNKKDIGILSSIYQTRFIRYKFPCSKSSFHEGSLNYFTEMVYAKFECFNLLKDYSQLLYTDYDIVIQKDINELFDGKSSFKIMYTNNAKVSDQFFEPIKEFNMDAPAVSCALFFLQDSLPNYSILSDWCYVKAKKFGKNLRYPEQAIFDLLLQNYNLSPEVIPIDPYCSHPELTPNAVNAKILHAWGSKKFWNGLYNVQFNQNYQKWLSLGGTPFKEKPRWPLHVRIKRRLQIIFGLRKV